MLSGCFQQGGYPIAERYDNGSREETDFTTGPLKPGLFFFFFNTSISCAELFLDWIKPFYCEEEMEFRHLHICVDLSEHCFGK